MTEQTYIWHNLSASFRCLGCGSLVVDRDQHNIFHSKTRSVV